MYKKVRFGRRRAYALIAAAVFCAALLTGCLKEQSAAVETAESGLVVGVSINSLRSPFMIALKEGIVREAEERGITLILSDCNGSLQTQVNQIRDFLVQEVDAVLMEPLDADALTEVVEEAADEGVPVFCVDTGVNSQSIAGSVGSDSELMGILAAEFIAAKLYKKYGSYRGKVVNLMASLTTTSGLNRAQGFRETMEKYPEIEIIAEQNGGLQLDTAMSAMTNILQANDDIDAIWCSGDTNAQGALRAMKWMGRLYTADDSRHIILVSADGAGESLDAIREGTMDACISQNPLEMGKESVRMVAEYLAGEGETGESLSYPLYTVTAENIDSEEFRDYGIWSEEIES